MSESLAPAAPLWRRFLVFLLPLLASNILQALSATINNIFLGQMLGVKALAAASVFFPVLFFFISFLIGLSSGASVLIGQAYGARNFERIKAVAGTVSGVAVLGGIVIGGGAAWQSEALMRLLGTPADIFEGAVIYARISFLSMPVMFLFFTFSALLRGVGDSVTPMLSLIISTVVSAVLTPSLIQGWFGLPAIGIAAPAVAGFCGFLTTTIWLGFYLRRRKSPLAPDAELARHLSPDFKILGLVLRIGVPTALQMVSGAMAGIVIIGLVNRFGSDATAAYGAVNQVMSYVQFPAISIAIAASIFGAQAIGAGTPERLGAVTRTALMLNLVLTGGLIVLAYLLSETIVSLFITDPAVIELSQTLLHIVLWSVLLFGAGAVISGVMRASGTVLVPMLLGMFAILCVEVPVAIWLSSMIGITGIWWGYVAGFSFALVLPALYYWFVWRKKTITALI